MSFALLIIVGAVIVYFWAYNNMLVAIMSLRLPEDAEKKFLENPSESIDMLKEGLEHRHSVLKRYLSIINFSAAIFYLPVFVTVILLLFGGTDAPAK